MLEFQKITLADKSRFLPYLAAGGERSTTRCFAVQYVWAEYYNTTFCISDGFLHTLMPGADGERVYCMPLGEGSAVPGVLALEADAAARGASYKILFAGRPWMEELVAAFPGKYEVSEMRDAFDYIYSPDDLIQLHGKKYQSKRNFVNRFLRENEGEWSFERVERRMLGEIIDFCGGWLSEHPEDTPTEEYELCAIAKAVDALDELDAVGGALRLRGRMIGFTLAAKAPANGMDVLFEKADPTVHGAYQMLGSRFAAENFEGLDYVNREEDMGLPGLRAAKESYHPLELTEKFCLRPKK